MCLIFCDLTLQFNDTTCTYSKVVCCIRTLVLRRVTNKRKERRYKLKPVNITVINFTFQWYFYFPINKRSFNRNTYLHQHLTKRHLPSMLLLHIFIMTNYFHTSPVENMETTVNCDVNFLNFNAAAVLLRLFRFSLHLLNSGSYKEAHDVTSYELAHG